MDENLKVVSLDIGWIERTQVKLFDNPPDQDEP